jgi:hypothetical protein
MYNIFLSIWQSQRVCDALFVCVNKKLANSQLQLSLVLLQHIDTCDSSNPALHPTTTTTCWWLRTQQQQQHAGVS